MTHSDHRSSADAVVHEKETSQEDGIPAAEIRPLATGLLRQSRLWWVTLACLLLAVWLAWASLPEHGPQVTIRFPDGHGLKTGDEVRFRGIVAGHVSDVRLNDTLSGVEVDVVLTPGAAMLNREGTRFWIVRPQLSLTEVSGLETAVGAKYIAALPGSPNGAAQKIFDGLAVPPTEADANGLQIILQSPHRYGIHAGAPITWRGVDVGRVIGVHLAPDARHVHLTAVIDGRYRQLVRTNSVYWVTSGIQMDVGLTGFKVNAESLSTIARGGIAMMTPDTTGRPVDGRHVFPLADAPREEWIRAAASAPLVDFPLPVTVDVLSDTTTSFLGISRNRTVAQAGLLMRQSDQVLLVTALVPEWNSTSDSDGPLKFRLQWPADEKPAEFSVPRGDCSLVADRGLVIPIRHEQFASRAAQIVTRPLTNAEDCLVVHSAVQEDGIAAITQPIDAAELVRADNGTWLVVDGNPELTSFHGAPVMAMSDGRVVGILSATETETVIVPFPQ